MKTSFSFPKEKIAAIIFNCKSKEIKLNRKYRANQQLNLRNSKYCPKMLLNHKGNKKIICYMENK